MSLGTCKTINPKTFKIDLATSNPIVAWLWPRCVWKCRFLLNKKISILQIYEVWNNIFWNSLSSALKTVRLKNVLLVNKSMRIFLYKAQTKLKILVDLRIMVSRNSLYRQNVTHYLTRLDNMCLCVLTNVLKYFRRIGRFFILRNNHFTL